jgi:hypothetical protein
MIPGNPALLIELKRRDHTKSTISKEQLEYAESAIENGALVYVALGCDAALNIIKKYVDNNL